MGMGWDIVPAGNLMPVWSRANLPEVIERFGPDPYLLHEANPDGQLFVSDSGWMEVESPDRFGRCGALIVGVDTLGTSAVDEAVSLLDDRCMRARQRLCWLSVDIHNDWPGGGQWQRGEGHESDWVWMWTKQPACEPDPAWDLVELNDIADAEEINAFALPVNPLFEGNPGRGENLLWVGLRDDRGRLIGCITAHPNGAGKGHLAGLVVAPAHRRRGVARSMLAVISQRMIDRDGVCLLSAYAHNTGAIRAYEQVGYSVAHTFDFHFREPRFTV